MSLSLLTPPQNDPTPLFELFRGSYATELLTAAVAEFRLFELLNSGPRTFEELRHDLLLAERPALVLITALRAMGLMTEDSAGRLSLTKLAAEHLVPGMPFDVGGYIGLAAASPGVQAMVESLRANRPARHQPDDQGAAFIFREGIESAMDQADSARRLTMALAGRARNVAPALAANVSLEGCRLLLDVGGGTGLYAYALLQKHAHLRAIVWDRAEVLQVAAELAEAGGVADRVELIAGDMFSDPVPADCDAMLLSNVLHDWDVPECQRLIGRLANVLPPGGRLLIHDVFLNDALDGPLPIALYSAALFQLTEGRAYSAAEYGRWLMAANLRPQPIVPTAVHCGVLAGIRA